MKLQRYDYSDRYGSFIQDKNGPWVHFSDSELLQSQLAAANERADAVVKALAYVIRDLEIRAGTSGVVELGHGAYLQAKRVLDQNVRLAGADAPVPAQPVAATDADPFGVDADLCEELIRRDDHLSIRAAHRISSLAMLAASPAAGTERDQFASHSHDEARQEVARIDAIGKPHTDCPECGGSGACYGTNPVCCGRTQGDECCGSPEPEIVQCQCASAPCAATKPEDAARGYRDDDVSTDELIGGNS